MKLFFCVCVINDGMIFNIIVKKKIILFREFIDSHFSFILNKLICLLCLMDAALSVIFEF